MKLSTTADIVVKKEFNDFTLVEIDFAVNPIYLVLDGGTIEEVIMEDIGEAMRVFYRSANVKEVMHIDMSITCPHCADTIKLGGDGVDKEYISCPTCWGNSYIKLKDHSNGKR